MRKNILLVIAVMLFFVQTKIIAQTHCGWQQGDMLTYSQINWGDMSSQAGVLLDANFDNQYADDLVVGNFLYTLRFQAAFAIFAFLPAIGPAGQLNSTLINPISTSAGVLAGEVIALKLNVDFSDANLITGIVPFGDLVIHDFSDLPVLNGLTVRRFLATANNILAGAPGPFTATQAAVVANLINAAFAGGTPSQFAQDHLKKANWREEDMLTYTEFEINSATGSDLVFTTTNYNVVYGSTLGVVEVGIPGTSGFSMRFGSTVAIQNYFITSGIPAALIADQLNPTNSSSGIFGGAVLTLRFNIDFSDAGFMAGNLSIPFGDLILYGFGGGLSSLNGLTVRQFDDIVNTLLGGGSNGYSIADLYSITAELTGAFHNSVPSQFAQLHLKKGWQQGDMLTYNQVDWGNGTSDAGILLANEFTTMYGQALVVGENPSITYTDEIFVYNFLPAAGPAGTLAGNLQNPVTTSAGELAGEVLALMLNVDFSDASLLQSSVPLGDLVIHDFTLLPVLNGQTVRQFLATANYMLSGGTGIPYTTSNAAAVANLINNAFATGIPSQFAKGHLISPCDVINHCPVATGASVTTKVGTAINIQLQATDEDNDELSYSISQDPLHGIVTTSASGAATYTPTAGYYGADEFKFKANDGECDDEEIFTVTVVKCPSGKGYWINNPGNWPASAIPMLLGTQSYTQQQLVTILNTPVGNGNKADASLILAHQLIPAKLNVADGADTPDEVSDAIEAADLLIGNNIIPMKVKPNTALGQQMIAIAAVLENYNKALLTQACQATVPVIVNKQQNISTEIQLTAKALDAKLYPNPSTSYFNIIITSNDEKEKIAVQVFDQYGRLVSARNNISNGSTVRISDLYQPGVYYVRVLQGKQHKELKLVKLSE